MSISPHPKIDARRAEEIVQDFLARRPGYLPNWQPDARGPDSAIIWVFARYLENILQRLDQAPDKNRLAFLDLLGVDLIPARPSRAPVVFRVSSDASPTLAAAGTQVVAPPPPESQERVIFETEQRVGLSPAQLVEVYSLWPGRDAYIDHSQAVADGESFTPFRRKDLVNTPHHIYLAHDTLLALAGEVRLQLHIELTQTSSEHLNIRWEYWDGKVWRPFKNQEPGCIDLEQSAEGDQQNPDSTLGFTRSGTILLSSDCAESEKTDIDGHLTYWIRGVLREPLPPDPAQILPIVESVRISTEIVQLDPALAQAGLADQVMGLAGEDKLNVLMQTTVDQPVAPQNWLEPDTALFNMLDVDTSQTFFPLGQAPNPGDVFYIAQQEIFSKPGAEVIVDVRLAPTPADKYDMSNSTPLQPELRWEYWNGRRWTDLGVSPLSGSGVGVTASNFLKDGQFRFIVPDDMELAEVNDQEDLWVRAYLAKDSYGFFAKVTWNDGVEGNGGGQPLAAPVADISGGNDGNTYTYVIPQPPALLSLRLGYIWQYGPFYPEIALSYNDFQYRDDTEAARWPGQTSTPFGLLSDATPALYLGFDQQLPVDRLNLFFDIAEKFGETEGPEMVWEHWDGFAWEHLQVEDETNRLRVPGMLSWIGPPDSQSWSRFAAPLYWLRGRLKEDGPPGEPVIDAVYPNAVWAAHRQTVVDEPIGDSTGQPDQAFIFRQAPILPDEIIEVRELSGARAQVEWRLLALEILGDDYIHIQEIEDELRREGTSADILRGDLRLKRDRHKRVSEVWVRWQRRDHLLAAGPDDRHYRLERSRGRLVFGNGEYGKVPPPAAAIQARRYQTGGGRGGNVPASAIQQLLGGIGGVEQVFNPRPAEGGADAESLTQLASRGPFTLRHYDRALSPIDYETLAREASPAVALAQALPNRDPEGRLRPGFVTLIIIPNSESARPWPSFGLREAVRSYIAARAPASLAALSMGRSAGLYVTGPRYQPVDVRAVIAPNDPTQAGAVEAAARQTLHAFFHPLLGGPERSGWQPGRAVYLSDVAPLLERVPGVDFVKELGLLIAGALQGEHARIPMGHIAVAGDFKIQIVGTARGPLRS